MAAGAYDPDFSHAMLVALLVKLGGSVELTSADLTADAMGDATGRLYALSLEPLEAGRVRLSVHPTGRE